MKLPVKKEFDYSIIGSYRNVNPFTIAFVYPKNSKAYIVKGGLNDVKRYLEADKEPSIRFFTMFHKKKSRTNVKIHGLNESFSVGFLGPKYPSENIRHDDFHNPYVEKNVRNIMRHELYVGYRSGKTIYKKRLRKIPRKWMEELNEFV